ncbi:sulfate transporter family-domain-containing protein [Thamnocephalis sphaerospora]|uniref:Sulfate transporter family-domain-containing protein n=1 Tax=Thamnocephalis sphaerospora TaxID=78915 RepID=A0A4P9XKH3_9FUNG|nr:sulfate transporter family-domain-containing protein [Thamnocephalis sphaerospora]|eukprot:RKP06303.1 sulfate transporter family-domain-containing protein [Thamnocephalis sphaerospora]
MANRPRSNSSRLGAALAAAADRAEQQQAQQSSNEVATNASSLPPSVTQLPPVPSTPPSSLVYTSDYLLPSNAHPSAYTSITSLASSRGRLARRESAGGIIGAHRADSRTINVAHRPSVASSYTPGLATTFEEGHGSAGGRTRLSHIGRSYYAAHTDEDEDDAARYMVAPASIRQQSLALGTLDLHADEMGQNEVDSILLGSDAASLRERHTSYGEDEMMRQAMEPGLIEEVTAEHEGSPSTAATGETAIGPARSLQETMSDKIVAEMTQLITPPPVSSSVPLSMPADAPADIARVQQQKLRKASPRVVQQNESTPLLGVQVDRYTSIAELGESSLSLSAKKSPTSPAAEPSRPQPVWGQDHDVSGYYSKGYRAMLGCRALLGASIYSLPAVVLGLTLNLLDAISYGLIIFPVANPIFDSFGPTGISMFLISTAISQVVFSGGMSIFKGGNGSMMIEVMPFLHIIAEIIIKQVGQHNTDQVIATVVVAYALSTVMTGVLFLLLGAFKLGSFVGFFPRHILIGTIGGVGYFLMQTGVEVTSGVVMHWSRESMATLFSQPALALWSSSLACAVLLQMMQHKVTHPLFVPCYFLVVPAIFYVVTSIGGWSLEELRSGGWLFQLPEPAVPFYDFWLKFDFGNTVWSALPATLPTMLSLTFFGILHVPINIPALGVSTGEDNVDTNRELIAHGVSNLCAGLTGTIQSR